MEISALDSQTLQAIEERIFAYGEGSVEAAAAQFELDQLLATIRRARARLRDSMLALPTRAFEAQPPDSNGEPAWSAGEIVAHLAESMLWLEFALARLAGHDPDVPDNIPTISVLDRAATLALLDDAGRLLDSNLATATELTDQARTDLGGLGVVGVRGLLLLHAMHEAGHADQLHALGED